MPHIRFNQKIVRNTWNGKTNTWTVLTSSGEEIRANVIISGVGALHVPKLPSFPGIETFTGEAFHTALWKKNFDPSGICTTFFLKKEFKQF